MIDLEEERRREDDPVAEAEAQEMRPDMARIEDAAAEDKEPAPAPHPEDEHVALPPDQLARLAGIQPRAAEPAAAPTAEAAPAKTDDVPAAAHDLGDATTTLAERAPESEHAEDAKEQEAIPSGEFGPQMAAEQEKDKEKDAEPSQAPVDGKAALAAAAGAAAGVAAAAHEEEKQPAPAAPPKAQAAATADADGFAGTALVGGKQKWNEDAHYKKDNTSGFDVSGKRAVTLGKKAGGQVDAADAAVYATAAVETSGTYDAVQTYDKGILSFGIMQWTLHQGSLMKFLDFLKSKCGPDGKAAFDEHFGPLGIDVHGESLVVGGASIKPDDAGRKQLDKLVRADKDTTRRWVVAFHTAGQDERVARAQWVYTKKQYTETAGKSLDKYTGFARKKGYTARHPGQYRTPSFWCRDPEAAALFFSMTANNPGYSYYGVIRAADAFMDGAGPDPARWPQSWTKQFLSIYAALLPTLIESWKGRVEKTLQHLHLAQDGKSAPAAATSHARPTAPVAHPHAPAPHAPAELKAETRAPQPAPEEHHGLRWLADVMTRKVVRGLEDATTAARHFLGIATTGAHDAAAAPKAPPAPAAKALAEKIETATPRHAPDKKGAGKGGGGLISSAKLHKAGGSGKHKYALSDEQFHFKQQVYEAAVGAKVAKGQVHFSGLSDEELTVCHGKQIKKDVAPHLETLMTALHGAWQQAKAAGDAKASKVTEIGLSSGYRGPEHDFELWDAYFQKYYEATAADREATGEPHGTRAVQVLVKHMGKYKAPPGFSNHTGGTAVDMHAIVDGQSLGADAGAQDRWYASWVWHWLHDNAARFGFKGISTEAWHWEFHG